MSTAKPAVLVVVSDEQEQRDLNKFLGELGLQPTVARSAAEAIEHCEQRSFNVILLDGDSPAPGSGLHLLPTLRKQLPHAAVIVLSGTRSFDLVLSALRGGARDVVIKAADQIDLLQRRVLSLADEGRRGEDRDQLLLESAALNEEFLLRLTDLARRVGDLKDQLVEQKSGASPLPEDEECRILIVEEDNWLTPALSKQLPKGFSLRSVVSGGSALDKASAQRFHIALVKEGLPDLPGRMVVRTLLAQSPETITLLFSPPSGPPASRPGQVQVVEGSHMIQLLPSFTEPQQLLARLTELREAQRTRGKERRYLAAFREQHYDLLRRYAELRQRLGK